MIMMIQKRGTNATIAAAAPVRLSTPDPPPTEVATSSVIVGVSARATTTIRSKAIIPLRSFFDGSDMMIPYPKP